MRAAKGREHVTFHTRKDTRGDLHVVPEDARLPLAQGKLDPRLFDVTGATPRTAAAQVSRELPVMCATAASVERSGAYWPTARKAEHVWLDARAHVNR